MHKSAAPRFLIVGNSGSSLLNFRAPLLRRLVGQGFKVTACVPVRELNPSQRQALDEGLNQIGVQLHPVELSRTGLGPVQDIAYCFKLRRLMADLKPDRVLAYAVKPVIYGGLAARSLNHSQFYGMLVGLGYAFTEGTSIHRNVARAIVSLLLKAGLKGANTTILQNPDDEAELRERHILTQKMDSAVVSGSGVDTNHYSAHPLSHSPERPAFLMVSRVLTDKGVREFARAAEIVKSRHPEAEFRLLGKLDDSKPNSPTAEEISSWSAVDYLGSTTDVRPYLNDCHAFVLPSYYREGIPRAALEALAVGRAVITADSPGCRETVTHGKNGLLVPVRDAQALARSMESLICDPQLFVKMGKASHELAMQRFEVGLVNNDMLNIMGI